MSSEQKREIWLSIAAELSLAQRVPSAWLDWATTKEKAQQTNSNLKRYYEGFDYGFYGDG
jgi:outer membrane protein TolC